jgi:hypothetical protein
VRNGTGFIGGLRFLTKQVRQRTVLEVFFIENQGRIQDFKLGGALKKIATSGGRRENFWGISCEKSRFYAKKSYFFQF